MGRAGSVMSRMLALPSSTALHGGIEHADGCTESDVTEFALTWYIRPSPLMIVFSCPCGSAPFLLYLTLKPKLALLPGSPALWPAGLDNTRKPPPVIKGLSGFDTITAVSRSEERRVGKECRSRWSPY